ncbi:cysteine desulfurase family protein [Methylophaga sulfidovorans]|uniref:cysteine desulfurase n=1 Tax=Methylophaga sulfidovorans TaxID=45496 RepID=A0A1I3Z2R7_9GAMM|nr:cysteine desulfurase family protein [Methylophaga sulfidovorans]SFK38393.1 cysteine desulfurase [Methylophaga sulfidovorans]
MQTGSSIYLDYQATTPLEPRVVSVMAPYNHEIFANPHSTAHVLGQQSAAAVEAARSTIENCINASSEEVIFTSGATESNNQAIASMIFGNTTDRRDILISEIEHKCIKNAAHFYAAKLGYKVKEIPVHSSGLIDVDAYQSLLSEQTLLVCIMAVNNEIGTIQDVKRFAEMAHQSGALFHCDAAQAPEAIDIDVKDWNVDMLSLSAHKVYGPKGIGALYIKNDLQAELPPFIQGGGQQFGMRSGTLATPLCVGFAEAMRITKQEAKSNREKLSHLKRFFLQQLEEANIPFKLNGTQTQCHPGNLNVQFIGCDANKLLEKLQPNVCASTGSACNSEMVLLSHVLKAIGLTDEEAGSSLRISLGRFSDESQIKQAVAYIKTAIEK